METTVRFTAQDVQDANYARHLGNYARSQETSIQNVIEELDIDPEYSDAPSAVRQQQRAACLARYEHGQELLQQAKIVESRHFPAGGDPIGTREAEFEQVIHGEAVEVFAGWVGAAEQRCYIGLRSRPAPHLSA